MKYDRCKKIFGDKFVLLENSKIIILGVGGVGGHALDCLYRSGITNITIVDYDCYELSNQNRQIGSEAIGVNKVEHLKTLYPKIKTINTKINIQWLEDNSLDNYDLILDAIDDIKPKVWIIKQYYKKLISTTGSAKRIDSTKIQYINIWKTTNDPFAKKIREELKKIRFNKNFKVIFSDELPQCKELGSFVGVTGSFGLAMCSKAIEKILEQKNIKDRK
jgi:tRNA threonylcarbamoyladenosine dehydratase